MDTQIIALPEPQPGWIYNDATNAAEPVTLIAFKDDIGGVAYLAQRWRAGEMTTDWIWYVFTEEAARALTRPVQAA